MNKVLEYIIRAKDATGSAVSSALTKMKGLGAGFLKQAQNIRAAFGMMQTAATAALSHLRKAFQFETMTIQFKTLVGNMDEAREHMAMLQKMGDTPPFSLEEFAKASRAMMVMTDGALGFKKSLDLVGDAAAATGQPIENLAHEVGRAYAIIRDGQPLTRATMGLRNMGAITPEVASRLEELQNSGASNIEVWKTLEDALGKFKGAMEETEQTGDGLIGAISSQWDDSVRSFGAAFMDTAKEGLSLVLEKLKQLNESGSIAVWADRASQALGKVIEYAKSTGEAIAATVDFVWNKTGISDLLHGANSVVQGMASAVGSAIGGGSWSDIADSYSQASVEEMAKGYYTRKLMESGFIDDKYVSKELDALHSEEEETAKREEKVRKEAVRKKQADDAAAAKKRQTEEEKVARQMAEAQAKQDAKSAVAKRKADEEAAKKDEEEAEKARKKEEAERLMMEQRIHDERVKLQTEELKEREKLQSDAEASLADAQAKVRQAWGWYRDKDSLAAQIAEEKADAEARKQYETDFEKLKFRRDWRTADNLSLDQEAVRRVALAKEEEASAQRAALETAANTARAADALEAIQAVFDEGGE